MKRYMSVLRCQTWNVWQESVTISSDAIRLDVKGVRIECGFAVITHKCRSDPWLYDGGMTDGGALIWRGEMPNRYIVREAVLKDPGETIELSCQWEHARRGEVDVAFQYIVEDGYGDVVWEVLRTINYSLMAFINVRLNDYLVPVAPVHLFEVFDDKRETSNIFKINVRKRVTVENLDVEAVLKSFSELIGLQKNEKIMTALELYGAHYYEQKARTRFLLIITAFEVLSEDAKKHEVALNMIVKWSREIKEAKAQYAKDSDERFALEQLERELCFRQNSSIRSRIREMVINVLSGLEPEYMDYARKALKLYDMRSTLVHEGYLPPHELELAEEEARIILEKVFDALTKT